MAGEKKADVWDAMRLMAERNQDIGSTNTMVRAQTVKAGAEVTMGMPVDWFNKIVFNEGKYITCLFVINAEQLEAAKKELGVI